MENNEQLISVKESRQRKIRVLRSLYIRKGVARKQQIDYYNSKGCEHADELTDEDLSDRIEQLRNMEDSEDGVIANWRRRAMATCWSYLQAAGYESASGDYVKECICTSQRSMNFNKMTKKELIKAFYLFKKNKEDVLKGKEANNDERGTVGE